MKPILQKRRVQSGWTKQHTDRVTGEPIDRTLSADEGFVLSHDQVVHANEASNDVELISQWVNERAIESGPVLVLTQYTLILDEMHLVSPKLTDVVCRPWKTLPTAT